MNFPFGSPLLDTAVRLLIPFILLFAAYVVAHGHYSPGGGFQGGVILAGSLILLRLVHGGDARWGLGPAASLGLASIGLLLYTGIGLSSLVFGGSFLDYGALPLGLAPHQVRAAGSFGIEVGVGLVVTGIMVVIFDALMAWDPDSVD
ncbi:MAG TPA: MnhB domain-containing protein [Thermoanaerobaculia bacterium]|nr:MnhB domain-containing protein [Thermoanaerobaculia bacterium]